MSGYDEVPATAQKIYQAAVDRHLQEHYGILIIDGVYRDWSDVPQEEIDRKVLVTQNEYAAVPGMFGDFMGMPDPADFDDAVASMESVLTTLSSGDKGTEDPARGRIYPFNTDLKDMTNAADYLEEWDGQAAQEFRTGFIAQFEQRTLNQFTAACVIINALRAQQELWKTAREDVALLAQQTLAALDYTDDWDLNDTKTALSVVGTVVALGAVAATGGGAAAIALGFAAAGTDLGKDLVDGAGDDKGDKIPLAAETARGVITNLENALDKLGAAIETEERKVETAATDAKDVLVGKHDDYVAPEPWLVTNHDVGRPDSD